MIRMFGTGYVRASGRARKITALGEDVEEVKKLFADEPEFRPFVVKKHPPQYFFELERKLGTEGKIAEMVAVLEQRMKEDRVRPERGNFQEALTYLGRYGQARKAFQFYKWMQRMELKPSAKITASLFNACANCSPVEKEWALNQTKLLLSDLRSRFAPLHPAQYRAAIKAFARHGEVGWAFRVADFMVMDRVKPDLVTFVHLLSACISDRSSGFKLALDVWRAMHSFGIKGDEHFYNSILRTCRDCGLGPAADRVIRELEAEEGSLRKKLLQKAINNTQHLETAAIDQEQVDSRKVPSLQELNEQLDSLDSSEDVQSNPSDQNQDNRSESKSPVVVFIPKTNIKLALLHGANGVLKLMDRDGARPDITTFSLLLELLPVKNLDDEAQLWDTMQQRKVVPNVDFINLLMSRRCRRRQFESALELLGELRKHNLQPNERTFASLALGCWKYHNGLSLIRDMEALGVKPNMRVLFPLMFNALSNERYDFGYALAVMKLVKRHKLQFTVENLKFLETRRREAVQIEEKRRKKNPDGLVSDDGLPPVRDLQVFLDNYEKLLREIQLEDESVDPKMTLLDKKVTGDDLREDWEKPWVAQTEQQRQREALETRRMIPVE